MVKRICGAVRKAIYREFLDLRTTFGNGNCLMVKIFWIFHYLFQISLTFLIVNILDLLHELGRWMDIDG